jgi:predicted phage terminase large subunit-like protein
VVAVTDRQHKKGQLSSDGRTLPELTLKERIGAEKCRRDLHEFVKQAWHVVEFATPFKDGWHIHAITEHLEAVTNGQIKDLLINMPPRHSKSLLVSTFWPMWTWINQPDFRWLCASYALSLSIRDNRKCRILIESDWFRQRWGDVFVLSSDQNAKIRFENSSKGYRLAVSTESATTGEGGDGILCLDGSCLITTKIGDFTIRAIVEGKMDLEVLAYDEQANATCWKAIEAFESSSGRAMLCVALSTGKQLLLTRDHPVYVLGTGYVQAENLKVGMYAYGTQGERVKVRCVEPAPQPEYVYNIKVADCRNYYANGVLLHNCDDPISVRNANSEVKREDCLDWYSHTISTRLNDPKTGIRVVVMQRVHDLDLSGYLLEQGGYTHLCLPAEYEPERKCITSIGWQDPRTVEGELLWPEQVGPEEIVKFKRTMGAMGYASQFQQSPAPGGGAIFKEEWFRYFHQEERFYILHKPSGDVKIPIASCWTFATVDLAASKSSTADYTVIATWMVTPANDLLLIEIVRERYDGPEIEAALRRCYSRWRHTYMVIEQVAFQLTMLQKAASLGIPVKPFKPLRDKVSRAISASTFYGNGQIYHMRFADYLTDFEKELLVFPVGAHDDQADCVAMATEILFDPAQPNIRTLDDDEEGEAEIVKVMERNREQEWGEV